MITADIDTTNMCSHLRHKLMDNDGVYHRKAEPQVIREDAICHLLKEKER